MLLGRAPGFAPGSSGPSGRGAPSRSSAGEMLAVDALALRPRIESGHRRARVVRARLRSLRGTSVHKRVGRTAGAVGRTPCGARDHGFSRRGHGARHRARSAVPMSPAGGRTRTASPPCMTYSSRSSSPAKERDRVAAGGSASASSRSGVAQPCRSSATALDIHVNDIRCSRAARCGRRSTRSAMAPTREVLRADRSSRVATPA